MRCGAALATGLLVFGICGAAHADLFSCRVIVTGTDERSRPEALERCFSQMVVKLTGDPALAVDRRVTSLAARAAGLVEDVAYVDRMSDVPHHDEQGTRERPYDLIAHFDPAFVEDGLRAAGLRPWLHRPALVARVKVEKGGAFTLSADGDAGERQREALLAAGERFGLRIVLPTESAAAAGRVPHLREASVALDGRLWWSEADFGWNVDWRLPGHERWTGTGVSFDEAFRIGVGGAAARLSRRAPR